MSRVTLTSIEAYALKVFFDEYDGPIAPAQLRAVEALRKKPAPKKSWKPSPKKLRKERKASKKAAKNQETAVIYAAVMKRADGRCEMCDHAPGHLELHHAFGRVRVQQSARNCLALCGSCHVGITQNHPSGAYWREKQAQYFEYHGFMEEALRMRSVTESRSLVKQAAAVSRGAA